MTDLYDRLFPADSAVENIPVHGIEAAITLYATGEATRANIVALFSMDTEAESDLNVLLNTLDAMSTTADKLVFMQKMQAVNIGHEENWPGYQTKAQYVAILGL